MLNDRWVVNDVLDCWYGYGFGEIFQCDTISCFEISMVSQEGKSNEGTHEIFLCINLLSAAENSGGGVSSTFLGRSRGRARAFSWADRVSSSVLASLLYDLCE